MAAVASRRLPPPSSISTGSTPQMAAAGARCLAPPPSICSGRRFGEAPGASPSGRLLGRGVFLAIARRLDPPSRKIWMSLALSAAAACSPPPPVPADVTAEEMLPRARVHNSMPLPRPTCEVGGHPPEGEALKVGSCNCSMPLPPPTCEVAGHPMAQPEGEALKVGSCTCAAFLRPTDEAGDHSDGLLEREAFPVGSSPILLPSNEHPHPDREVLQMGPAPAILNHIGCVLFGETAAPSDQVHDKKEVAPSPTACSYTNTVRMDGSRILRWGQRGPIGDLPPELVLRIARQVARVSIRDAAAMKLSCKSWNRSFEISTPLLAVNCKYPYTSGITLLKIVSHQGPGGPLRMEAVSCLCPPSLDSHCWGSAHGLLALRSLTNNKIHLHCLTCGFEKALPELPINIDPKGLYFCSNKFLLAIMTDTTHRAGHLSIDRFIDRSTLYLPRLDIDAGTYDEGAMLEVEGDDDNAEAVMHWTWGTYPGTEGLFPMRSVNFTDSLTFAGATSFNLLILDKATRLIHEPFIQLQLGQYLNLDGSTATWMDNGQHIFICGLTAYLCVLTRSNIDFNEVGIRCFVIELNEDSGFKLTEVETIGPYSVYVGANLPLVLSSVNGVPGRTPNTVYVEDNDKIVRNTRVLAITIGTQEVQEILFPENLSFTPSDDTIAAWTAPSGDTCHAELPLSSGSL